MLSWRSPKQKVVLTGLRGSILPPLPPSSAGKPTVFKAEADDGMSLSASQPLPSGAGLGVESTRLGLQKNPLKD